MNEPTASEAVLGLLVCLLLLGTLTPGLPELGERDCFHCMQALSDSEEPGHLSLPLDASCPLLKETGPWASSRKPWVPCCRERGMGDFPLPE